MNEFFAVLLVIHFAWHIVASIGVAIGLMHSYHAHSHSKWKLVGTVIWLAISLCIMAEAFQGSCH